MCLFGSIKPVSACNTSAMLNRLAYVIRRLC